MAQISSNTLGNREREHRILAYCEIASRNLQLSLSETAEMRQLISSATNSRPNLALSSGLLRDLGVAVSARNEPTGSDRSRSTVSSIVEAACALDDEVEYGPFADEPLSLTLQDPCAHENPSIRLILPLLRRSSPADVAKLTSKLPVFPRAAREVMRECRSEMASPASLAQIARQDSVLAAMLLAEAATTRYTTDRPLTDLVQTIAYIGIARACEIMLTAALRPLFINSALPGLWQHSLDAASTAGRLAAVTAAIPMEDAYLLGLVHDVGRLLLEMCSEEARGTRDLLIGGGVPMAVAEVLSVGVSHAEAGAEALRYWGFPDDFVEAVRHHHEPEVSSRKASAFLYLLEFWTDASEDLPSGVRLQVALDVLGTTMADVCNGLIEHSGSISRSKQGCAAVGLRPIEDRSELGSARPTE